MALTVKRHKEGLQQLGGIQKPLTVVTFQIFPATSLSAAPIFSSDGRYLVAGIEEIHTVAGTDAGAVTLGLQKRSGTLAGGFTNVNLMSGTFNLKGTANTVQTATLTSTLADRYINDGDRVRLNPSGTLTSLAGVHVTLLLIPMISKVYYRSPQA